MSGNSHQPYCRTLQIHCPCSYPPVLAMRLRRTVNHANRGAWVIWRLQLDDFFTHLQAQTPAPHEIVYQGMPWGGTLVTVCWTTPSDLDLLNISIEHIENYKMLTLQRPVLKRRWSTWWSVGGWDFAKKDTVQWKWPPQVPLKCPSLSRLPSGKFRIEKGIFRMRALILNLTWTHPHMA